MRHQHEAWQLDVSAKTGGLYCKACGQHVPATVERSPEDRFFTALADAFERRNGEWLVRR